MTTRRQFLGAAAASLAAAAPADPQWNLLIITNDQHRADCLGCYGNPILKTPNTDRLASQGVRLENHFVQAPQCVPSRVSLHTAATRIPIACRRTRTCCPSPSRRSPRP